MTHVLVALTVTLVLLGAVPAGLAADTATETHSGTVAAVDPGEGVLILEELGPWQVRQGEIVVLRQAIALTAGTQFASFIRVTVPGRYAGDFLEVELEAGDITPGDFVTVQCVREGGRLVAQRVAVAETGW